MAGSTGSSRLYSVKLFLPGTSAIVTTRTTPGTCAAAPVSKANKRA